MTLPPSTPPSPPAVIVGAGPAGLMAAEIIAGHGLPVALYDAMPSVGRKFLLAGVGGMNLTHSEALPQFLARYGEASPWLEPHLENFSPPALREWARDLGIDTFVGSSGRVFPRDMKAAPLLRAWLHRLRTLGVQILPRHRWQGWSDRGEVLFEAEIHGERVQKRVQAPALVLALGGGSWRRLGSDGAWVPLLRERGIPVSDLQPSNCGFDVGWSEHFRSRFAGEPLPTIGLRHQHGDNNVSLRGEALITRSGIEGTSVYALSPALRDSIARVGRAELFLDLLPDLSVDTVQQRLTNPRGKNSQSNFLRKQLQLSPIKIALLREILAPAQWQNPALLAKGIKSLPLILSACRPLDEAISSAGGVPFSALDASLMLKGLPGVFCVGEMLDWEAPTGGYLLTACFATGRAAGLGVVKFLQENSLRD